MYLRSAVVFAGFIAFIILLIVAIEVDYKRAAAKIAEERKAELRTKKEREAADSHLFDEIERFRNDFDDSGLAG